MFGVLQEVCYNHSYHATERGQQRWKSFNLSDIPMKKTAHFLSKIHLVMPEGASYTCRLCYETWLSPYFKASLKNFSMSFHHWWCICGLYMYLKIESNEKWVQNKIRQLFFNSTWFSLSSFSVLFSSISCFALNIKIMKHNQCDSIIQRVIPEKTNTPPMDGKHFWPPLLTGFPRPPEPPSRLDFQA